MKIEFVNFSFFQWKSFFIDKETNNELDEKPNSKLFIKIISKSFEAIQNLCQSSNFYNDLMQSKQSRVNSRIFDEKKDKLEILKIKNIAKINLKTKYDKDKLQDLFLTKEKNIDKKRIIFFKIDFHIKHYRLICFTLNNSDSNDKWELFPLFWDFNHCIDLVDDKFNSSKKYEWSLNEILFKNNFF